MKSTVHQPTHINRYAHIGETNGGKFAPLYDGGAERTRRYYGSRMTFHSPKGCHLWFSLMHQTAVNTSEDIFILLRNTQTHTCTINPPPPRPWHFQWIPMMFELMPLSSVIIKIIHRKWNQIRGWCLFKCSRVLTRVHLLKGNPVFLMLPDRFHHFILVTDLQIHFINHWDIFS